MSIAEFYVENGIDPSDPDSYDAWLAGAMNGDPNGAWEYAGQRAYQHEEADGYKEAIFFAWEQAKEEARNRLGREHPSMSRSENIRLAEEYADLNWRTVGRQWNFWQTNEESFVFSASVVASAASALGRNLQ